MDFAAELLEISKGHAEILKSGIEVGKREPVAAIRAIVAAYDAALTDPACKMPTPLHAAIENARRLL